jgi:hypothetical protein
LKNSAASTSADTTRKKLKYTKYSPKSVAPRDAARLWARTLLTVSPSASGSIADRSFGRNSSLTRSAGTPSLPLTRNDVSSPYRDRHSR